MGLSVSKNKALVEDIEFGIGASAQTRTGTKVDATFLPYSVSESVSAALDARYTAVYTLANFANINGNSLNLFEVANGTIGNEAVNFGQLDLKEDKTVVATKADKTNVLEKDNITSYTPLFDYNPTTKVYVDNAVFNAFTTGLSTSFQTGDGRTATFTNGLLTGLI